ncbi:MAG TPA: redoxin domain-containing protein, partial [Pirellulales bacterium]|nr:redoxin domain-containing protein [Pirellulales bacterium]
MSDSWSRTLPVSDPPDAKYGEWRAWVQDGWLLAERRTGDGEIEWKIVLARIVGDEPPEIVVNRMPRGTQITHKDARTGERILLGAPGPIPGALRLSYCNGRFFIRDEYCSLRCLRQFKTQDDRWPELKTPPADSPARESFSNGGPGSSQITCRASNAWFTAVASPQHAAQRDRQAVPDSLVRLFPTDLQQLGGLEFETGPLGPPRIRYGEWFLVDDGELLVAEKLDAWRLTDELEFRARFNPALALRLAKRKLAGSPPPDLSGEVWLNTELPQTWKELHGKTVLLVLFDLEQPSFLPLMPPLLGFQEMYGKQGLVVIGVHANHPRDEVKKKLADERITFPVLIDDGKTAERFGIGFSACLLIDREGKVVAVYKDSLAPPAEIEKLLEA